MTNPTDTTPIATPVVQVPGGDLAGAVLELLRALDRDRELNSLGWKDNFKNYDDWLRARRANTKRLERARARFHIPSTTQRDNADESEVTK